MAYQYGVLTMADVNDYTLINTVGQGVVYQDLMEYMAQRQADLQAALGVFVETETELYTENYKLPGGGFLERRGGQAESAAASDRFVGYRLPAGRTSGVRSRGRIACLAI